MSSHQLNSIPKIMVQFCYLRLYVYWNCFLSSVATDGMDGCGLKLEEFGPTFSSFTAILQKAPNIYYGLGSLTKFCVISSSRLCRSVVCMGKGTTDHYLWKGVGKGESQGEGGSGLSFYIIWVGHYWNIKWKGVGCIFFIIWRPIKAEK